MNSSTTTDPAPQGVPTTSRRAALGLAAGGGLALTALGQAPAALAGPAAIPLSPVMPAWISDLAGGLDVKSTRNWHLARRVAPAPTKAVVSEIKAAGGSTKWIDKQLNWKKISDAKADGLVKKYLSYATMTGIQVAKASKDQGWKAGKALSISRTVRHVFTKRHLYESMVDTMADQLYVSADGKAAELVAWYDWAVLRKYALGKFSNMLDAAMHHPAMLVYLDNHLNSADNPNENLGRELLELHTVGVGNYDETDVRQSALILTGHGYNWQKRSYHFEPDEHYVGPVKVMGFTHTNKAGQGPTVLKAYLSYLAHHPGTAKRIAQRLAVRYVSDNPPAALVDRLAKVYLDNDTSLKAVIRALLLSPEFTDSVGEKWKRPQETMATMLKLRKPSGLKPAGKQSGDIWAITGTVQWLLYLENHQPRMWPVVDGYPDQAGDWMATQAMLAHFYNANARVNWGNDKEWPSKSWASALGITKGMTAAAAAAKITSDITGFTWNDKHLALVTARIRGNGPSMLTADQVKYNLGKTIHFVLCSPYFKLR